MDLFFMLLQTSTEEEEGKQSLIDLIMQGGPLGAAIVGILLFLSVIALYIFIERYLTIQRAGKIDQNFMNNIRASVAAGNIEGAKALCRNVDSPIARMVEKGLMRIVSRFATLMLPSRTWEISRSLSWKRICPSWPV